ncbi:MAG TPA: acyl carrier protein [Steroidobacter sp.]|uniref:acyl carrier protein n=1 Tax=Steroidobacter sp. TaxID=1978227 RepID=UPI002ED872FD
MTQTSIRKLIVELFNQRPMLKDIDADQDFFEVGASSLTIVDLQIQIEEALNVSVPTSELMRQPTLAGWTAAYAQAAARMPEPA